MSAFQTTSPATALCTSCGLCCDGFLHGHVVLEPNEVERAKALGLPLLTDGRCGFSQPCPKLVECCCSIYDVRPSACSGYECRLLEKLVSGDVTLDAALQTVVQARAMADIFEADRIGPPAADPREAAEQVLRRTTFRLFLDRHFRNDRDGPMVMQEKVAMTDKEIRE